MRQGHQQPTTVPDADAALRAVAALRPPDPVAALLHLLLPQGNAVGMQARLTSSTARFRGRAVPYDARDVAAAAGQLTSLVAAGAVASDRFCDLAAPWHQWVKPVRSGAFVLLAGTVELFGGPTVRVEESVATPQLLRELAFYASDPQRPIATFGTVVGNARVTVDGSTVTVAAPTVTAPSPPVADLLVEAARTCQALMSGPLGVGTLRWSVTLPMPAGRVQVTGLIDLADGSRLEVPVTVGPGSALVGIPQADTSEALSGLTAPEGFTPFGLRLHDGAVVVEHTGSGIRAALVRRPRHPTKETK